MKLKSILIASLLASAVGSAWANDYTAPTIALTGGPVDWTIAFGTSHSAGAFTDTYTFTYSGMPGNATGFYANAASPTGDITFSHADINGNSIGAVNIGGFSGSIYFSVPVSGTLTMTIKGSTTGVASYAGTLDVVSSVPEPETYGMMLGGLGVLAFLARRRKS